MADIFYISMPHMSIDLQTSFYRTVYDLLMIFICLQIGLAFICACQNSLENKHKKRNERNSIITWSCYLRACDRTQYSIDLKIKIKGI